VPRPRRRSNSWEPITTLRSPAEVRREGTPRHSRVAGDPASDGLAARTPTGSRTTRRRDPSATVGASGVGRRYST
jgi:hypothetical protein